MIKKLTSATSPRLRWYLVQSKPGAAQIAARNLENQGFGTFLPLQEITKRNDKTFQQQIRPLFPGYLFVQLNPNQGPWRQVNSTRGVARLVRVSTEPSVVPNNIVTELMAQCDDQQVLRKTCCSSARQLHAGKQAQVTQGPLSGFIVSVTDSAPNDRINILIEMMGQATKIAIDARALQPLG